MNEVRRPIVEWTRQNAITDDYYPDAPITVDTTDNTITIETFMRSPDGDIMLHGSGYMFTELRTYPMLVPPPPGLLEAYERLRQSISEENGAAAAIRRETMNGLIEALHEAGFAEAANHLVLSKLAANPVPARQLVKFNVEVARVRPRFDGGSYLAPDCSIHVRPNARLYHKQGSIIGFLDWCEIQDGVLWLAGRTTPYLVRQFNERTDYPSLDIRVLEWADRTNGGAIAKAEITSAMVEDMASYPWAPATKKEGSDVRP